MAYNSSYNLMRLYPHQQKGNVNVRSGPNTSKSVLMTLAYPSLIGTGTGNYEKDGSYNWYEINTTAGKGWVRDDLLQHGTKASSHVVPTPKTKDADGAKRIIEKIVSNDFKTYHFLQHNDALIARLKLKGKNVATYEAQQAQIAQRYQERQQKLQQFKSAGNLTAVTQGFSEPFVKAWEWLKGGFSGIGALPVLLIPVISALLVGGAAVGSVWIWIESSKPEEHSAFDLDKSQEMNDLLKDLVGRELNTTEKQKFNELVTAYGKEQFDAGYDKGDGESFLGISYTNIKAGLLVLGGAVLFKKFSESQEKKYGKAAR